MFSESNFVGDIIKLRTGTPIYTPPEDNNSLVYTPLSPILTYAIAWLIGLPTSIVGWRIIQLGFVFCAALVGAACCRRLYRLAYAEYQFPFPKTWYAFTVMALFLVGTAPTVNRFVHSLHADALALLISTLSYWALLAYMGSPNWRRLTLMTLFPAVGFLTKQFLVIWAPIMFLVLLTDDPKKLGRLVTFTVITGLFITVAIGGCYWLWGEPFLFWIFEVVGGNRRSIGFSAGGYHLSLLRSIDHTARTWLEIGIGLVGGWLILRGPNIRKLGPLWLGWLALIGAEALTSGVGWGTLYHFGPGVMIGAMWLFAALPRFWPFFKKATDGEFPRLMYWVRPLAAVAGIVAMFVALRVVPSGAKTEPRYWKGRQGWPDVYRYISEIEGEFEGLPPEKVLLDVGNWIYLRHSVVMKDRASSVADQPPVGIYNNINVMVARIRDHTYSKILVRDFHSPVFLYDWGDWKKPSGVKKALKEHYIEVRTIRAPVAEMWIQHSGPVSVFVAKSIER